MKILFTGGTGLIGSELIKHLAHHQIVLLTRDIPNAEKATSYATGNHHLH